MMRNGVDLEKVNALTEAMRKDAAGGKRTLSGITSWNGGAHSTTIVRNFPIPADEPVVLGGTDRGVSPMELTLTALAACVAIAIAYSAAEDGVEVDSIELDVEGNLDLRGFFEVSEGVRPGFEEIRLTVRVDADAPWEKIEELVNHGYRRSPVAGSLEGRVPIRVCLVRDDTETGRTQR
ncbi:hypothetical protein ES707_05604 [subsurface metagenome]